MQRKLNSEQIKTDHMCVTGFNWNSLIGISSKLNNEKSTITRDNETGRAANQYTNAVRYIQR